MYTVMLAFLISLSAIYLIRGIRRQSLRSALAGLALGGGTILFFSLLDIWGEVLGFQALGYQDRIRSELLAKLLLASGGFLAGGLAVFLLTLPLGRAHRTARILGVLAGGTAAALWGPANWEVILKYGHRVETGFADPILNMNTGFYLFALPFYDTLFALLVLLTAIALAASAGALYLRRKEDKIEFRTPCAKERPQAGTDALFVSAAALLLVLAWGRFLERFHLVNSTWGTVNGAGGTDLQVRVPACLLVAAITALAALALGIGPIRARITERLYRRTGPQKRSLPRPLGTLTAVGGAVAVVWLLALTAAPGLFQWLRVKPNELSLERPYIANNIRFARSGFDLDRLYKQFQEMRLYNEFAQEGPARLPVKNIPPVSEHPDLEVEQPEIYYGELTAGPAVVNSKEAEFDYPKGEESEYIHVVPANGRLYWLVDCRTTSSYYPCSEPFSGELPEERLAAVMHGGYLSYAETFEEALEGLITGEGSGETVGLGTVGAASGSWQGMARETDRALRQ